MRSRFPFRSRSTATTEVIASGLSIALRTIRLQEDATGLRDYQARLLDSANALILGIDRSWRITVCNRALLELTGTTRDEVLGRDVRDFMAGDQRQQLTTAFSAALAGNPEYPHYTRPATYRGWNVPEVLLSGDHARIREWRIARSRERAPEGDR